MWALTTNCIKFCSHFRKLANVYWGLCQQSNFYSEILQDFNSQIWRHKVSTLNCFANWPHAFFRPCHCKCVNAQPNRPNEETKRPVWEESIQNSTNQEIYRVGKSCMTFDLWIHFFMDKIFQDEINFNPQSESYEDLVWPLWNLFSIFLFMGL